MQTFVCHALKAQLAVTPGDEFHDFLDLNEWRGVSPKQFKILEETGVDGVAFLIHSVPRDPDWALFLRGGLEGEVEIPSASAPGALIIMRVVVGKNSHYFAFTFGTGRHLLRSEALVRRFGLRVVLNAVFEDDTATETSGATRLRSIDAKRVSSNTVRMRHQTSQIADFEAFDVDRNRDFLHGVTGVPKKTNLWGKNMTGSDSLTLNRNMTFGELPKLCTDLVKTYSSKKYKHRFGWVDDVGVVTDTHLVEALEKSVASKLSTNSLSDLELTIPEVVDWHRISGFMLPTQKRARITHPELRIVDSVSALSLNSMLQGIDAAGLRAQRIEVVDGNGDPWKSWSVWQCITGEISHGGRKFILDEGDFYEVSTTFLNALDNDIKRMVPPSKLVLPQSKVSWEEGKYNEEASKAGMLLMDKRNVKISKSTSPVEICDLLTRNRQFVHVKRKLGSALLSHLFAQGYVSADLFQISPEFRKVAGERVREVKGEASSSRFGATDFDFFGAQTPQAGAEVVYAIVADWGSSTLVDRLPFFSKINLRRHAVELNSRGFNVTHVRVQTYNGSRLSANPKSRIRVP